MADFSDRLKELMQENKMTHQMLADRYDMDRTSVGKWVQGKNRPDLDMLVDLAKLFEVSTDYLTGVSNIRNPYEIKTIAAHHDGEEYSEEEQKAIEEFKEMVKRLRGNS